MSGATQAEGDDRSIAAAIERALRHRIISGALPAGTPLRQDHIAAAFRASHVPVREAFRRLEAQGLAVAAPRRGVRVAPLDAPVITEVTEMRAALEALALRHALARWTTADRFAAEAALDAGEAGRDIAAWEDANRRFHRAITAPCAMPRLMAAIDDLHRASARFLFATWRDLDWQPRSEGEHRAILAAATVGDADAAGRLLQEHILDAGRALAEAVGAR
jgi:DNA-binding GntR family transcriptional regulator